jgi:hypothetical protein
MQNDSRLPFRLCVVEPGDDGLGWFVTGFMSKRIERLALQQAELFADGKRVELNNLLQNKFLRGGLGIGFERWIFDALADGSDLSFEYNESTTSCLKDMHVNLKGMHLINSGEALGMDNNVLYKFSQVNKPSIEGYALVNKCLLLLQTTVSKSHSAVHRGHVQDIISAARIILHQSLIVIAVYIAPSSVKTFTLPHCSTFTIQNFHVVRGRVNDGDFMRARTLSKCCEGESEGEVEVEVKSPKASKTKTRKKSHK